MVHKGSLNPRVAFFGDMRENGNPYFREQERKARLGIRAKDVGVYKAWEIEFPGEPFPHYWGSIYDAYRKLEERGWKFSSRYGWRKETESGWLTLTETDSDSSAHTGKGDRQSE